MATFPRINKAEFVVSAFKASQFPPATLPEIAFAGRSNVGKSSLMNRLMERRRLVKVSSRPGFTQSINFFLVDQYAYLVDLPGYGFAKAPKKVIHRWHRLVEGYLEGRPTIAGVVCIMDIRREPDRMDLDLLEYLNALNRRIWVVLNKTDKLSQPKRKRAILRIRTILPSFIESPIPVSAKTGQGIPELLNRLRDVIEITPSTSRADHEGYC